MGSFFLGLLFMLSGVGLIYYSTRLVKVFGRIRWAEDYLGGTAQFFILFGFILIVLAFLVMFGVFSPYEVK